VKSSGAVSLKTLRPLLGQGVSIPLAPATKPLFLNGVYQIVRPVARGPEAQIAN
jgi:hypothetical protein